MFPLIQPLTGGPNYSTSTLMYYLYRKSLPIVNTYANTIHGVLAVIAIVSFIIQDPRKRRRILKKGDSYATTKEEPLTAFCYLNDYLALVDRTVHLSITGS